MFNSIWDIKPSYVYSLACLNKKMGDLYHGLSTGRVICRTAGLQLSLYTKNYKGRTVFSFYEKAQKVMLSSTWDIKPS